MRSLRTLVVVSALGLVLGACSSSSSKGTTSSSAPSSSGAPSTTAAPARVLRVLVTNDDGVKAPGIDTLVQALRSLADTDVTVVAPAMNQSGTGGKTTPGTLTVQKTTTASGFGATAVNGHPADTIIWAIDDHGIPTRPDVVLSGINNGQNIGRFIDISGTVGAARAAATRGIPALALSAGLGAKPDFADAATAALAWLASHRAALLARGTPSGPATVTNINVPTCPSGAPRPVAVVPVGPSTANVAAPVVCTGSAPTPTNDVDGFVHGYIVETDNLALTPSS
jgi:5'-nucleotidase